MLLAEIHGKRCDAVLGDEDYLTSSVFGHLRNVKDGHFWTSLFSRAHSVGSERTSLADEMRRDGLTLHDRCRFQIHFWPFFPSFGEPDLVMRFESEQERPIIVVIEVKLHSMKSGQGPDDQLRRYFDLLHDASDHQDWLEDDPFKALIYLTAVCAADEVRESVSLSSRHTAGTRMFALQWQDILETARSMEPERDSILGETARFLEVRQFERFRGMRQTALDTDGLTGAFYRVRYFTNVPNFDPAIHGGFYGKQAR